METENAGGAPECAPAGFEIVNRTPPYPALARTELSFGAIVQYDGSSSTPGGTVKHFYVSDAGMGYRFAVWGASDLDAKMAKLPRGAVLFLRYEGESADAENPRKETHIYTVARSTTEAKTQLGRQTWAKYTRRLHETLERLYKAQWGDVPATREAAAIYGEAP